MALGNSRVVKSFGTEKKEIKQFRSEMNKIYGIGKERSFIYGIFMFFVTIFSFGSILAVLWYGATLVVDGEITVGNLTSFVMYTVTMSVGLLTAGGTLNDIISAVGIAEKLF